MALDIRFFQRQGVPPASAVSISLIDNLGTYTVQIVIILAALVFGFGNLDVDLRSASGRVGTLLLVLVILVAVVIVVVLMGVAVPRLRNVVLDRVRPHLTDVRDTVTALRSPTRVARLLLSNLGAEVFLASTLGAGARLTQRLVIAGHRASRQRKGHLLRCLDPGTWGYKG